MKDIDTIRKAISRKHICDPCHKALDSLESMMAESSQLNKSAWVETPPTVPGWYWYEDAYYNLAPVYLAWSGFINDPNARSLDVDMEMGEDQELVGTPVSELQGRWVPLQEPGES